MFKTWGWLAALLLLPACAGSQAGPAAAAPIQSVPPAPSTTAAPSTPPSPSPSLVACTGKATPAVTEGPYFKAGSPERASLIEPGIPGTPLVLSGRVLTAACTPIAGAVLDFWQADRSGVYDNSGYRLRGHQSTNASGHYSLDTVVPGEYPGRTVHVHVKLQAPGRPLLTTQLFFPGVARNQQDSIFDPALLMDVRDTAAGKAGSYDFVVG